MLITQAGMHGTTESVHRNLIHPLSPRPPVSSRLDEAPFSVLLHPSSPVYPIQQPSDVWMCRPLRNICVLDCRSFVGLYLLDLYFQGEKSKGPRPCCHASFFFYHFLSSIFLNLLCEQRNKVIWWKEWSVDI